MAAHSSRLTRAQTRRFGGEIGVLVLVIDVLLARRGAPAAAVGSVAALGAAALAISFVRPEFLGPLADRWMQVAARISRVTTPVLLTVVYLVVLTPMAWLRRTVGQSPIVRSPDRPTYWVRRPARTPAEARASMERQF
jgi:hypothetical protein